MDKKFKVCHITSVHPPFDIRIFYKECVSLAKSGYNVTLIAPISDSQFKDEVEILPIKLPVSRLKRMLVVTFRMYQLALKTKSTIYHFHDPELMLCGILLRLSGKKVIFDVHENVRLSIISKDWIPNGLRSIIGFFYFIFERFAILFYNKLILAEESYLKYYPNRKSIVILNYPLNKNILIHNREFVEPIKFVYSGVVHPLRGVWEMLEIMKRLVDSNHHVSLDLVGEVRPLDLHMKLKTFITDNNLEACITIHGKVNYSEVSRYLEAADIGFSILQPIANYKESLPTKIFEYMQHGLPVIANDFPLYKKYVEEVETGICVDIDDKDAMFLKIENLLKNQVHLQKISKNGMELTKSMFNWKSQEIRLLNVYNSLEL